MYERICTDQTICPVVKDYIKKKDISCTKQRDWRDIADETMKSTVYDELSEVHDEFDFKDMLFQRLIKYIDEERISDDKKEKLFLQSVDRITLCDDEIACIHDEIYKCFSKLADDLSIRIVWEINHLEN